MNKKQESRLKVFWRQTNILMILQTFHAQLFRRQIFSASTYQHFGVIFMIFSIRIYQIKLLHLNWGCLSLADKINKQLIPPNILTRHHHQPQLWFHKSLPHLKFNSEVYPWTVTFPIGNFIFQPKKNSGAIYVRLQGGYLFLFLTRPAKKTKKPKPKQFRKLELLNRLLPGENEGLEPKDHPEMKRKKSLKKEHLHFGLQNVTFQGARVFFPQG